MDFVVPLFAVVAGGAVAWVVSRSMARLEESRKACDSLQSQLMNAREELRVEAERRASAEASLAAEKRAQAQMSDAFKALSAEALRSNNQAFLDLANATLSRFQEGAKVDLEGKQKAIDETLKPLKESLEKVDQKIHLLETDRKAAYDLLTHRVKELVVTQGQLQTETANLVRALRAPHTRGRWGELQLKRVVEIAGMLDRCDFREQQTVEDSDGRQLRPDMVIHLPGGRSIVVDSKVSLAAYLDALEAKDDAGRTAKLKDHASQIRTHLTKLSQKSYWAQFDSHPEFVVAFLPGETFFSAALEQDPGLIEYGVEQKVILATPTTLIALLKAISYGWRQEKIAENAREISTLGSEIYERLRMLAAHFSKVGDGLDRAMEAYNKAAGTLESRVLVTARRIKEKGAAAGADIPVLEPLERASRALQAPDLFSATPPDKELM